MTIEDEDKTGFVPLDKPYGDMGPYLYSSAAIYKTDQTDGELIRDGLYKLASEIRNESVSRALDKLADAMIALVWLIPISTFGGIGLAWWLW